MDKKSTQTKQEIFANQQKPTVTGEAHGDVLQEGCSEDGAPVASHPMSLSAKELAALAMDRKNGRTQKHNSLTVRKPRVTMRINPIMYESLLRKAKEAKIPHSVAAAVIFERAMQLDVDMHYGPLLEPVLERGQAKSLREQERQTLLLSRMALDIGQVRAIAVNILGKTPGMNQDTLATIIKESEKSALANATRITSPVIEVMKRLKEFVFEEWKKRRGSEAGHGNPHR